MVPGKLSVLWKMASPRRYVDPDYMQSIAAEIYGGNFREDPSLIHAHAENMKGRLEPRLSLSTAGFGGLDEPPVAALAEAADARRHGSGRSDRADGQWPDPGAGSFRIPGLK